MSCPCNNGLTEVDVKALILQCLDDAGAGGVDTNTTYSFDTANPNADGSVNLVDSDGAIIGPVCPVCSEGGTDTTYVLSGPVDNTDGTATITLTGSDGSVDEIVIDTPTFELPDGTAAPDGTAPGSVCVGSKLFPADPAGVTLPGLPDGWTGAYVGPDANGDFICIPEKDEDCEIAFPDGNGGHVDCNGDPLAPPAADGNGDPIDPDSIYLIDSNGDWFLADSGGGDGYSVNVEVPAGAAPGDTIVGPNGEDITVPADAGPGTTLNVVIDADGNEDPTQTACIPTAEPASAWPFDCPIEEGAPLYKGADGQLVAAPPCKQQFTRVGGPWPAATGVITYTGNDLLALSGGAINNAGTVAVYDEIIAEFINPDPCHDMMLDLNVVLSGLNVRVDPNISMFFGVQAQLQPIGTGVDGVAPYFPVPSGPSILLQGWVNTRDAGGQQTQTFGPINSPRVSAQPPCLAPGEGRELQVRIVLHQRSDGWADLDARFSIMNAFSGPHEQIAYWNCC